MLQVASDIKYKNYSLFFNSVGWCNVKTLVNTVVKTFFLRCPFFFYNITALELYNTVYKNIGITIHHSQPKHILAVHAPPLLYTEDVALQIKRKRHK